MLVHLGPGEMREYYAYLRRVAAIHHEAVRRLVDHGDTNPLELAELFEDTANLYLDISENIRARFISEEVRSLFPVVRQLTEPWSPTRNLEEEH